MEKECNYSTIFPNEGYLGDNTYIENCIIESRNTIRDNTNASEKTDQSSKRERGKIMQITDVRVRKVAKEGKLKAIVSITIDDEFVVHDIKVIEGEKGLFIAMPSKKALDGEYRDIAHPINSGTRDHIQTLILEKYKETADEVVE